MAYEKQSENTSYALLSCVTCVSDYIQVCCFQLIGKDKVVVFMKGKPNNPKVCDLSLCSHASQSFLTSFDQRVVHPQ